MSKINDLDLKNWKGLTDIWKTGDFVLDPFAGSGTTLIEAQRMNRNSIGIELQENVAVEAIKRIHSERKDGIIADTFIDNSKYFDTARILELYHIENVQFIIFHPPYWDIIKFSENEEDLSNSKTLEDFIENFRQVVRNTLKVLATIVKNFEETKGKANQQALWRQRALQNGLYIFKHEYIFVFKKEK